MTTTTTKKATGGDTSYAACKHGFEPLPNNSVICRWCERSFTDDLHCNVSQPEHDAGLRDDERKWTDNLRSHHTDCAQRYGGECNCGAFEHNEQVYQTAPSDPAEPRRADDWNVQAIDDDYDGVYDCGGVLIARVPVSEDNNARRIKTEHNSHASLVAALEQAQKFLLLLTDAGVLDEVAARHSHPDAVNAVCDAVDDALKQARSGE